MEENFIKINKKKEKIKLLTLIVSILLIIGSISYAFFVAIVSTPATTDVSLGSETSGGLVFTPGTPINLTANLTNFAQGSESLSGETKSSVNLKSSSSAASATESYYVYYNITSNNFIYTVDNTTPELILTIIDPAGNEITDIQGLTHKTVVDASSKETITGFDVTEYEGLILIDDSYVISTTDSIVGSSQEWNVRLTFVNLDTIQTDNEGKIFESEFILQKEEEQVKFSTWIWNSDLVTIDYAAELNANNVNNVYLFFHTGNSIEYYFDLIKILVDAGIEVQFLFGDPNHILESEWNNVVELFNFVESYNSFVSEVYKIDKIHIDVEPYNDPAWETAEQANLVLLYQQFLIKVSSLFSDYELYGDVPFWYDHIEYDNEYGTGKLIDFVEHYFDGLTLMAYNDDPLEVITFVEYELEKYNNMEIAVEYGELPGSPNVTFFEEGIEFMLDSIDTIRSVYPNARYAIHQFILN